jgi:hypothetical protein
LAFRRVGVRVCDHAPVAGSFVLVRAPMRAIVLVYRAGVNRNVIDIVQRLTTGA